MLSKYVVWCLVFLGTPCIAFQGKAQYFSKLFDLYQNSPGQSAEGGTNVFINNDSSYFVTAFTYTAPSSRYGNATAIISPVGDSLLHVHYFNGSTSWVSGIEAGARKCGHNNVAAPFGIFHTASSSSGMVKYDSVGNVIFAKTYTDTTKYTDGAYTLAVLPDSSFLVVGERDSIPYLISWGYLQHISSSGQLLWMRTYMPTMSFDTTSEFRFTTVQALPNHNILVGGLVRKATNIQGYGFHFNYPWMLLLDSSGNFLKDTLYDTHYVGGGSVFSDINGGYFHYGAKDSLPVPFPKDIVYQANWPDYVAHLDTNFKMDWRVSFPHIDSVGYGSISTVKQTKDSGYLVMGSRNWAFARGWLVKLDKNGNFKWEHRYYVDSSANGYLVDAEERTSGGFVAVGWTQNCKTCSQDVWLLSVDSNGCQIPGCSISLGIPHNPVFHTTFEVYPNPTHGDFTINTSEAGQFNVYDLQGVKVSVYPVNEGKHKLDLPNALPAGIYIGRFQSADSKSTKVVRIVYEP